MTDPSTAATIDNCEASKGRGRGGPDDWEVAAPHFNPEEMPGATGSKNACVFARNGRTF